MSNRLFGPAVSLGAEKEVKTKFSLDVEADKGLILPENTSRDTLDFINSSEALLLMNANDYDGFLSKILQTEGKSQTNLISTEEKKRQKSANWFSDYNYVYTYFALATAVAVIAADVVKNNEFTRNYQLTTEGHEFILILLGAARHVGGLSFTNKIAQTFLEKINQQAVAQL